MCMKRLLCALQIIRVRSALVLNAAVTFPGTVWTNSDISLEQTHAVFSDLEPEGEDGHDDLEDERQAELPHGRVDAGGGGGVRSLGIRSTAVHLAAVLAELRRLQRPAVREQLFDQLAGVLPRVRVRERHDGRDSSDRDHLQHRVPA